MERKPQGIGDRIATLVDAEFKTRTEAARALDVNPALLSRWITNDDRPPSEETLRKFAERFRVPVWWVRYGIGSRHTTTPEGPVAEVLAIAHEHTTCEGLLANLRPNEAIRVAYRTAIVEGWGLDAVRRLTRLAGSVLGAEGVVEFLSAE